MKTFSGRRRLKSLASVVLVITTLCLAYQMRLAYQIHFTEEGIFEIADGLRDGAENTNRSLLSRWRPEVNVSESPSVGEIVDIPIGGAKNTIISFSARWRPAVNVSESPSVGVFPPSDVLINGYMRSGSSILGRVLGHRNDTFYWFEPLQRQFDMEYIRHNLVCHVARNTCRSTKDPTSLETSLRFLRDIYNCTFHTKWRKVSDYMQGHHGGPSWEKYLDCRKNPRSSQQKCLNELTTVCKNLTHRVIKTIRLSLDNAEKLLDYHPELKILHLFRDPRGQINSHLHTDWLWTKRLLINNGAIRQDAVTLCDRMLYDIQIGKKLMKTYPGRIRFLQYEDFDVRTQVTKLLALYKFIGMSHSDDYHKHFIENLTDRSKVIESSRNHPYVFRTSLDWPVVRIIDAECWKVYEELGYVRFDNDKEFRNLNISSSKDPLPYAVT